MNKRKTKQEIGFIQGIAYAVTMIKQHGADAHDIITQSGIKPEDFIKYAEKSDLAYLQEIFNTTEK
ncbi:hypothetical protein AWH56_009070 [Anaerobacillus isosaccharinicus]|uniref:Uncharacterized protein n=1 Tax=Anaerobacillus isosaccharinicus TaxID=1532552 RepID=A0A1S2MCT2_9BACI|nr:hypothetical protein [Anaerobacillus isosaccharinicus]MBA5588903.1 hypothetical protein [Anaerobacillus isosaccharinicus]QOY37713.1 hypothetical protein AWH56_009070 [Anaerobacillus isosaccharinicus]